MTCKDNCLHYEVCSKFTKADGANHEYYDFSNQAEKCECFKDCHRGINYERLTPTADVAKVVRCKDCKHYEFSTACCKHFCNEYGGFVTENDYCSRAEKSDGIIREV